MTVTALRPNQPKHPLAGLTFYHGTDAANIPSILEKGILPKTGGRDGITHACLTTDLHCALLFGRLNQVLSGARAVDIAVITIPGEALDPKTLCVEWGSVTISAYGQRRPGRSEDALHKLGDDWKAVFAATDCIGVQYAVPVREDWVDTRFLNVDLQKESIADLLKEMERGATIHPVLLERMAQEPRWMTSTPEHAERVA